MPTPPTVEDLKALITEARMHSYDAYNKVGATLCTQTLGATDPWIRHVERAEEHLINAIYALKRAEQTLPSEGG